MIFVTLGTQDFQFNRLLKEIDVLIESGVINEEVFAQTGHSTYKPEKYNFVKFIDSTLFSELLSKSSLMISHGGVGSIVEGLKKGRKIIAVPRLRKFQEHVDDHQMEIVSQFSDKKFIVGVSDIENLGGAIESMKQFTPRVFISENDKMLAIIDNFISSNFK